MFSNKFRNYPHLTVSRVLSGRYYPNSSILDVSFRSNSSFFWKGFVWGLDLLKRGIRKNLGSSHSIRMFSDPWLPKASTFRVISPPTPAMVDACVAEFYTPSLQWDLVKLNQYLVPQDVEMIKGIPISPSTPDRWILALR